MIKKERLIAFQCPSATCCSAVVCDCCELPVVCCVLSAACCLLSTLCCLLSILCCLPPVKTFTSLGKGIGKRVFSDHFESQIDQSIFQNSTCAIWYTFPVVLWRKVYVRIAFIVLKQYCNSNRYKRTFSYTIWSGLVQYWSLHSWSCLSSVISLHWRSHCNEV